MGFSLIELLTVIAIVAMMATFGSMALSNNQSTKVNVGGNLVVDMANRARQNSMAKGVMTALVMARDTASTDSNYRAFILLERASEESEWKPVTPWTYLPEGIAADPDHSTSFVAQTPNLVPPPNGAPNLNGIAPTSAQCSYQVYLPDGRLSVKGIATATDPMLHLIEKVKGSESPNYYKVTLNLLTGTPNVERQ